MKPRSTGFTLVEMMVVVGIISALAGIVFATFFQARESARQATCVSNLHQIGQAAAMYSADYDGSDADAGVPKQYWQLGLPGTMFPLDGYIKDHEVLICPDFDLTRIPWPPGTTRSQVFTSYAWVPALDTENGGGNPHFRFSLIVARRGGDTPLATCDEHNPHFTGQEVSWTKKRVIVVHLDQHVTNRLVPVGAYFPDW